MKETKRPATALYMRSDKRHLPAGKLYQTTLFDKDSVVKVSDDPNAWLCMQCHAPNGRREIGTEDDKTPTESMREWVAWIVMILIQTSWRIVFVMYTWKGDVWEIAGRMRNTCW